MRVEALAPVMDERMTRLWAAEAEALGPGGTSTVTRATGIRGNARRGDRLRAEESQSAHPRLPRRLELHNRESRPSEYSFSNFCVSP